MNQLQKPVLQRLQKEGIVRARELNALGLSGASLARLVDRGVIQRVGRGLYALPDRDSPANYALATAAKRVPRGVVCLLSALQFHGLTTQLPREVWLAIGEKDWRPTNDGVRIRTVRFSPLSLREGVEVHRVDGINVRVFNPAKTIADCFKYRNKLGLDVAMEALRDGLRQRKCTVDELSRYAKVDRVSAVIRPYMEALV
jgi:predicted transcriptional regulator of viral defense system